MKTALAILGLLASAAGFATSVHFETFGPILVMSRSSGELSSDTFEIRTRTSSELQVKYLAPASHCSAARMHFVLDGTERGISEPVGPGRSSGYFDFGKVQAGEHVVGLRAEGVAGGCNNGKLISWGGLAMVRSGVESDTGVDPRATSLGANVFYAMTISHTWGYQRQGVFVTGAGDVFAFQYDPQDPNWIPALDPYKRVPLFDLQERFSHHARWLMKLDDQQMRSCEFALASIRAVPAARNPDLRYDAPHQMRGAYRLDVGSGRYFDMPCLAEAL